MYENLDTELPLFSRMVLALGQVCLLYTSRCV